jgi:hypothetical protein
MYGAGTDKNKSKRSDKFSTWFCDHFYVPSVVLLISLQPFFLVW